MSLKIDVKSYWEKKVCGAVYGMNDSGGETDLERMAIERYRLEPYILDFARFESGKDKRVLEIGIGGGVDFSNWIRSGARATGIDLTQAGVAMTRQRLSQLGIKSEDYQAMVGDAENLPFAENTFDIVYSYGVLHHSPDTERAFKQVYRVLKPGGVFKAMIYHVNCWVGLMFWGRYSLLAGRPWQSPYQAMYRHLESPGTKTYTRHEANELVRSAGFTDFDIQLQLSFSDLLLNKPRAKRYQSLPYRMVWKLYPRWFVRLFGNRFGMSMFITARK
jgi:ubiquinone/menaquinone biosynthesis C-methylase UbiE